MMMELTVSFPVRLSYVVVSWYLFLFVSVGLSGVFLDRYVLVEGVLLFFVLIVSLSISWVCS